MPLTSDLPGCSSRMANTRLHSLLMAIAIAALGTTTAISSLAGEPSVIQFVGPAERLQPRSTNDAVTFKLLPQSEQRAQQEPTPQESTLPDFRAFLREFSQHSSKPTLEIAQNQNTAPTQLPTPNEDPEEVAAPENTATKAENTRSICQARPSLASLSTDISLPDGTLPSNIAEKCAVSESPIIDPRMQGIWAETNHHWAATCLKHRPLYFEEVNAERYGYTASYCLQPLISAGRFFLTIPALPYKMAVECPKSCSYTLGHYRPGSRCVPRRPNRLPLRASGSLAQIGMVAGLILLIP